MRVRGYVICACAYTLYARSQMMNDACLIHPVPHVWADIFVAPSSEHTRIQNSREKSSCQGHFRCWYARIPIKSRPYRSHKCVQACKQRYLHCGDWAQRFLQKELRGIWTISAFAYEYTPFTFAPIRYLRMLLDGRYACAYTLYARARIPYMRVRVYVICACAYTLYARTWIDR